MQLQQRALEEKEHALNKNWSEREAVLKGQEDELMALRTRVGGWDEQLRTEVDLAVQRATEALKQSEQIRHLQVQLDAAKQQVQDIAVKAIDGASKRDALDQVMQVSRERDQAGSRLKA